MPRAVLFARVAGRHGSPTVDAAHQPLQRVHALHTAETRMVAKPLRSLGAVERIRVHDAFVVVFEPAVRGAKRADIEPIAKRELHALFPPP
jgi:hypothetical protein